MIPRRDFAHAKPFHQRGQVVVSFRFKAPGDRTSIARPLNGVTQQRQRLPHLTTVATDENHVGPIVTRRPWRCRQIGNLESVGGAGGVILNGIFENDIYQIGFRGLGRVVRRIPAFAKIDQPGSVAFLQAP